MIGMTPEKFLDALPVNAKLFFDCKENADQRECQLAFGIGRGRAAAELGGLSKELQPSRATRYAIDDDCAGKYPEEQNPQLMASATVNLNLPPLSVQGVSY